MRPIAYLTAALLVIAVPSAHAQFTSRFSNPLPPWADSALQQSRFWQRYDALSHLNPQLAAADLDGDGLWDIALTVVDRATRRRGVAIIHQIDRSVNVVGAGEPVGTAREVESWSIAELLGDHAAIAVEQRNAHGLFVWNGHFYVWVPT